MSDRDPLPSNAKTTSIPEAILAWMASDAAAPEEFIVQADLPRRTVGISKSDKGTRFELNDTGSSDRDATLMRLYEAMRKFVPSDVKLLKAAGAIAVRVLPDQLRCIAAIPGIREIRPNRKLGGH